MSVLSSSTHFAKVFSESAADGCRYSSITIRVESVNVQSRSQAILFVGTYAYRLGVVPKPAGLSFTSVAEP